MSISHTNKSILNTVAIYEHILEKLTEDEFVSSPPGGGWSYAEVYSHIFNSNLGCLMAIDKCVQGKAIHNSEALPFPIKLVFFFGRLPPGKFQVPEKLKSQVQKISRSEARELVKKFRTALNLATPGIGSADRYQKLKHPRLGLLNAVKWFEFIDIHTRHHRKQLSRIERSFGKTKQN